MQTEWSNGIESQVRLIAPLSHNNNQNELYLGLQYKLQDGWKTYWRSSGEGGFPQEIHWQSSENVKNLKILWPAPQYFEILGFTSIGYSKDVVFPLKIGIEDINKKTSIVLDINYLTCKDICIPGNAHLELIIPPNKGASTEHYFTIQKWLSSIPKSHFKYAGLKNFSTKAIEDENNISIIVSAESKNIIQNPKIFLHSEFGLPVVKPEVTFSPNLKKINAKFSFDKKNISKNNFVLSTIFKNKNNSFEYISNINVKKFSRISILNNPLIYVLIISLVGGLILNIMPCVLPVLSIKILSVLKQSTEDTLAIRRSFFITSIGIIFSFVILALSLIGVRLLGVNIGWGMQFQQPIFLMIIAIILFVFTINIFGFFEFRTPGFLNSTIIKKLNSQGYSKDFFNGFFATLLATPCSAPFVGTAITVAFTQSTLIMLGIFIFMGIGMASPYLFISIFPGMTKVLPKPGKWIQYIKYFLGTLLLGTFIWIVSILISHSSFFSTIIQKDDSDWLDITTIDLEDLKQQHPIIFVDITADWCATCQFNKINVINSKIIRERFKDSRVIKVRGDWTKPNIKIENFLQSFNKYGIPFNVIYTNKAPYQHVLSELLSKEEIIKYIDKD